MAKIETMVSCPFCRRVYKMMIDREAVTLNKTRASCGRCGNSFELATRFVASTTAGLAPQGGARPATSPATAAKRKRPVDPRSADDAAIDELARDIARAADGFSVDEEAKAPAPPAGKDARQDDIDTGEMEAAVREVAESAAVAHVDPAPLPAVEMEADDAPWPAPPSLSAKPAATAEPVKAEPPRVETAKAGPARVEPAKVELAAKEPAAKAEPAKVDAPAATAPVPAPSQPELVRVTPPLTAEAEAPRLPPEPAAPRSWLELADPGLSALGRMPGSAEQLLEQLLA